MFIAKLAACYSIRPHVRAKEGWNPSVLDVLRCTEGGLPISVPRAMQAAPMHEPPPQCSRTRSALPQDALCAEGAVLSPVLMQLPSGAPLRGITSGTLSVVHH